MSKAAGIVLCGGRSSRMGRPKAWLPFGDEVLLQRTVRILSEVVQPVIVVAAPDQSLPSLPAHVQIARDDREYLGPLNGLATGLTTLGDHAEIAYLSSCDVPFLRSEFVRHVIDRLGDADICMPEVAGYRHPLAAAYRTNVLPDVRALVDCGRLRPIFLTDIRKTRLLSANDFVDVDPELASLRNANTIEEYDAALRDAGYAPAGPA